MKDMQTTDIAGKQNLNDLLRWQNQLLAPNIPIFSDLRKVKTWGWGFVLYFLICIWSDTSQLFDLNPGHYVAAGALFMILFVYSNMRFTQPGHCLGLMVTGLVSILFAAYLMANRRYDFETEKWITGILMAGLLVFTTLFKLKKKLAPFVALGKARVWMYFHIYSGGLAALLLLFHTGFHFPVGFFSNILFFIFLLSILLGLVGMYLQKVIPLKLADLDVEVIYEKIPEIVCQLKNKIEGLTVAVDENRPLSKMLAGFCDQEIQPFFRSPLPSPEYFFSVTAGLLEKLHKFEKIRQLLNEEEKSILDRIKQLYIEKQQLDVHKSLQWILRVWLWIHVIFSSLLIILIVYHVGLMIAY
ncbi:MAG: hypothetical protein COV67_10320 [Nitrospinae bacterium CG11_big_fil_rev_8_21_14_0_20_56_8]|nr:MAG: hypothetical protein COV67_10320 [Nitrospinae bacterium CG11_big_fil_rev_8_21_14_0_20_56_8]